MNTFGKALLAAVLVLAVSGAYWAGLKKGPDLTLTDSEKLALMTNEVLAIIAVQAPVKDQKAHDDLAMQRKRTGLDYANALRKRHRCPSCIIDHDEEWRWRMAPAVFQ